LVKEKVNPRDTFILCSDGLWSEVSNGSIKDALLEDNIGESLEELVGMVLNAGAPDNITGVLFRINDKLGIQ
jgi:serine/threonine protein phosphatase PrpC